MHLRRTSSVLLLLVFFASSAFIRAQSLGALRGHIRDATGALIPGANVDLKADNADRKLHTVSNEQGSFLINGIPFGKYTLEVSKAGFATKTLSLQMLMDAAPTLEIVLKVRSNASTVEVHDKSDQEMVAAQDSSAPVTVSEKEITDQLPGASRMSSLAFITETTPGAFVLHDHLHVRGGHQINWMINGVPVPNTNMSSNVGRAMSPEDISGVQINRGGYGAQSGDRTYAMVNMFTRTGFELENEGDLNIGFGSYNQTNDQLSFGGHNERFARYFSVTASRTDLALEPPVENAVHNTGTGEGVLGTFNWQRGNGDQYNLTLTARNDRNQVPVDPTDTDASDVNYKGVRDIDEEQDSFGALAWNHPLSPSTLLTVAPVYHINDSRYIGGAADPLQATSHNFSTYVGNQSEIKYVKGKHNLVAGIYGFYQHNTLLFKLVNTTVTPNEKASVTSNPIGGVGSAYVNEQYQPWKWLTLNAGLRYTYFEGADSEKHLNPRVGGTITIPHVNWIARGYYGSYFQAPPLYTVGGGIFSSSLIGSSSFGYSTLKGERDISREFGLTIPFHGWVLDLDHFANNARNFLDHDMVGNSNILLPLTTPDARMRGAEATLRSPELLHSFSYHLAYSNMMAEYRGSPSGGLIETVPTYCLTHYCYLDHDQRNTLSTGFEIKLPHDAFFSNNVLYGSGVVNGDGDNDDHTAPHTTADLAFGMPVHKLFTLNFSVINLTNSRYALSSHNLFAGTHVNNPREVIGSIKYHFALGHKAEVTSAK